MGNHRRRSRLLGKKRKEKHKERQALHSPSPDSLALAEDLQETDSEDDYGEDEWDPHAGTKPSPLDGEASDEQLDPEDDMEDVESEAFNALMVKMLSDLQDDDLHDQEWKPTRKHEKKKNIMKNG